MHGYHKGEEMKYLSLCLLVAIVGCAKRPPVSAPSTDTGTLIEWAKPEKVNPPVNSVILFPFNVDTLTKSQIQGLAKTAHKANLAGKGLEIVGFADTAGSDAYNLALGRRRALAVHLALIANVTTRAVSMWANGHLPVPRPVALMLFAIDEGLVSENWLADHLRQMTSED